MERITTHLTNEHNEPFCGQMEAILVNSLLQDDLGVYQAFDSELEEWVYIAPSQHRYCPLCMNWAFLAEGEDRYFVYMIGYFSGKRIELAKCVNFAVAMNQYEVWLPTAEQENSLIQIIPVKITHNQDVTS